MIAKADADSQARIDVATVVANTTLCREHYRLTCRLPVFPPAQPGQFVHIGPATTLAPPVAREADVPIARPDRPPVVSATPLLRRAFSVAGLSRGADGVELDMIYRVVGTATRWMESLRPGDALSLIGPLGNRFPIRPAGSHSVAWLIAGGVGLPPMLWLAEALHRAKQRAVAFVGARTADLFPLTMRQDTPPDPKGTRATHSTDEFSNHQIPIVLSTDDGSFGFPGSIVEALTAFHHANPTAPDAIVAYTCGPEPMMRAAAAFCSTAGIECFACMERSMACGTGLCQSCVIPVRDESDADGWRYALCCTDGPVFDARRILWEPADST